jgi:hypothetical protein
LAGKTFSTPVQLENTPGDDQGSAISVLAVGESNDWRMQGGLLPKGGIAFLAFDEVNETTLEHLSPTIVYSPVLAPSFDCIELALLLNRLGYAGAYRAVAQDLPKPDLIEREVRQLCGQLDFRIVLAC